MTFGDARRGLRHAARRATRSGSRSSGAAARAASTSSRRRGSPRELAERLAGAPRSSGATTAPGPLCQPFRAGGGRGGRRTRRRPGRRRRGLCRRAHRRRAVARLRVRAGACGRLAAARSRRLRAQRSRASRRCRTALTRLTLVAARRPGAAPAAGRRSRRRSGALLRRFLGLLGTRRAVRALGARLRLGAARLLGRLAFAREACARAGRERWTPSAGRCSPRSPSRVEALFAWLVDALRCPVWRASRSTTRRRSSFSRIARTSRATTSSSRASAPSTALRLELAGERSRQRRRARAVRGRSRPPSPRPRRRARRRPGRPSPPGVLPPVARSPGSPRRSAPACSATALDRAAGSSSRRPGALARRDLRARPPRAIPQGGDGRRGARASRSMRRRVDRLRRRPPRSSQSLDEAAAEIAHRLLPLLLALAALLLAATFREAGAVARAVRLRRAGRDRRSLGAMGYAGVRFNLVVAILPPILFVIALASAVHLMLRCRDIEAAGLEAGEATLATYRDKGRAVFWTTPRRSPASPRSRRRRSRRSARSASGAGLGISPSRRRGVHPLSLPPLPHRRAPRSATRAPPSRSAAAARRAG